jgi:addiction module RelB/DinJ family antitoxin
MASNTTLFRTRVPSQRLKRAEKILGDLGIKPGDAFNMLLAQIELRKGLPFEVTTQVAPLLSSEEQAAEWDKALGAY